MNKTCAICKNDFPLKEFNKRSGAKDGLQNACRECNRQASRKYYKENRDKHLKVILENKRKHVKRNRQVVNWIKSQHGCAMCDETEICCMDFHHTRDKKREVSYIAGCGVSVKTLLAEINKCICVCANCHRKIHAGKLSTANLSTMLLKESEIKAKMQTLELKQ